MRGVVMVPVVLVIALASVPVGGQDDEERDLHATASPSAVGAETYTLRGPGARVRGEPFMLSDGDYRMEVEVSGSLGPLSCSVGVSLNSADGFLDRNGASAESYGSEPVLGTTYLYNVSAGRYFLEGWGESTPTCEWSATLTQVSVEPEPPGDMPVIRTGVQDQNTTLFQLAGGDYRVILEVDPGPNGECMAMAFLMAKVGPVGAPMELLNATAADAQPTRTEITFYGVSEETFYWSVWSLPMDFVPSGPCEWTISTEPA